MKHFSPIDIFSSSNENEFDLITISSKIYKDKKEEEGIKKYI